MYKEWERQKRGDKKNVAHFPNVRMFITWGIPPSPRLKFLHLDFWLRPCSWGRKYANSFHVHWLVLSSSEIKPSDTGWTKNQVSQFAHRWMRLYVYQYLFWKAQEILDLSAVLKRLQEIIISILVIDFMDFVHERQSTELRDFELNLLKSINFWYLVLFSLLESLSNIPPPST